MNCKTAWLARGPLRAKYARLSQSDQEQGTAEVPCSCNAEPVTRVEGELARQASLHRW